MWRKIVYPHSLIATCLVFMLIWLFDTIRINLHFLNPFNKTIRDYEITDIVYSRLRDEKIKLDDRIVLVNTGKPDRDTLRMVIDRIVDAGAKVVAVDILLDGRKNPHTDSLLRATLMRMENVVLAMEIAGYSDDDGTFKLQTGCDTFFCNYVYSGFINFISKDSSSTIRYFTPRETTLEGECPSFVTQTAKLYDPSAVERLLKRNNKVEEIFYTENGDQFIQYETKDVLNASTNLHQLLHDKIVLVGFLGTYAWDQPMLDRHYTPLNKRYTGRKTPDMYGMVIHANILQMILNGTYVVELSVWANVFLTFIFCYINIHLFYEIFRRVRVPYHFITRFVQLGEIILLFFIVALLFHFYRLK
ncbi:MAG: CHASE2 domain-containing protein, partial [Saprospiraceae bacterium]